MVVSGSSRPLDSTVKELDNYYDTECCGTQDGSISVEAILPAEMFYFIYSFQPGYEVVE
jgi:hypothetical protein